MEAERFLEIDFSKKRLAKFARCIRVKEMALTRQHSGFSQVSLVRTKLRQGKGRKHPSGRISTMNPSSSSKRSRRHSCERVLWVLIEVLNELSVSWGDHLQWA